jgi:3-hydroxyisobutyrate dehydrogenase
MKIGFIGTGNMGYLMARNLQKAGHALVVRDLRREACEPLIAAGAAWADTPKALAEASEVVFGSLPKPADVEQVFLGADGLLAGMRPGQAYFDLTTSEPLTTRRLAAIAAEKGVHFLDAPVSGGKPGAENATLAVMVGGDKEAFERHLPLLNTIGKNVFHMGGPGNGNVAKLVNNMISFCNRTAAVEGLLIGAKAGVDPVTLVNCIRASSGSSSSLGFLETTLFQRNFAPSFTLDLATKDIGLAIDLARALQVPLTVAPVVQQLMIRGLVQGWANESSTRVATLQEQAAGVELRAAE